jgi:energy-converting hydrogenase B subunit D
MIWQIDFWLMLVLVIAAITALEVRDLLAAIGVLTGYSFLMALLFAELGAPDVALTEAALGAGLTGVFLLVALAFTDRRSED